MNHRRISIGAPVSHQDAEGNCEAPWISNDSSSSLNKYEASAYVDKLWTELQERELSTRQTELQDCSLTINDKTIRWNECIYSRRRPPTGHSLWISMHGGGGCPAPVNDEQYENQIHLYDPSEGIWVVPRSPTDSWNQWHQDHIDPMFNRIIENYIMIHGINPNRVYILGYSAGGDGVYQLAPRMADRFAAASMMAGHPNDASPLGLRNLPFAIFVGENDDGYDRNKVARQWSEQLDALQASDPDGYHHYVNICKNMGHWMCGQDAEALNWMSQWTRKPWPKKVVWVQDDVIHQQFYWLALPDNVQGKQGQKIVAEVDGQTIRISTSEDIRDLVLCLSDVLIDLDQPIDVRVENHGQVFEGFVPRTKQAIEKSLQARADPTLVSTAQLTLHW